MRSRAAIADCARSAALHQQRRRRLATSGKRNVGARNRCRHDRDGQTIDARHARCVARTAAATRRPAAGPLWEGACRMSRKKGPLIIIGGHEEKDPRKDREILEEVAKSVRRADTML